MFFEVFSFLCAQKGESANGVAKKLGIASGTVSEWKHGRSPRNTTLQKIADYFGVSVDYLLGKDSPPKSEKPATPQGDEQFADIWKIFSSLSPEDQAQAVRYLEFLYSSSKTKDKP